MTAAPLHLAFCIDDGFAPHMAATLESVRQTTPGPLVAHVLHGHLDAVDRNRLHAMAGPGLDMQLHAVSPESFAHARLGPDLAARLSVATYYRFVIARLLPKAVTRVLYLDADMIALHSLRGLYETDLRDAIAAAASETKLEPRGQGRTLGLKDGRYFSAGLMLIDLAAWRAQGVEGALMAHLADGRTYAYNDQDILNLVLARRVLFLDHRYNVQTHAVHDGTAPSDPVVIHFTGPEKPWRRSCIHPWRQSYRDARDATLFTPWAPDLYLDDHDDALLASAESRLAPDARVALYGAGERGRRLMLALQDRLPALRVVTFLDRDARGQFNGVSIQGEADFDTVDHVIVTSAAFAGEITATLEAAGVARERIVTAPAGEA